MEALLFRDGSVVCDDISLDKRALAPKEIRCAPLSVEFSNVDRGVIAGSITAEMLGIDRDETNGIVLGRHAHCEVIEIGSAVSDFAVNDLVYTVVSKPIVGHGFARDSFITDGGAVVRYRPTVDKFVSNAFQDASLWPLLEHLTSAHLTLTGQTAKQYGIKPVPGSPQMFIAGGSRYGHDIIVDTRLTHWVLRNALVIGTGVEALLMSAILSSLGAGTGEPNDKIQTTAALLGPNDPDVERLLREIGVFVQWINGPHDLDALPGSESFDCVHLVNTVDGSFAAAIWDRVNPFGIVVSTNTRTEASSEPPVPQPDPLYRLYGEPDNPRADVHGSLGIGIARILEQDVPGCVDRIPALRLSGMLGNAEAIDAHVRKSPWSRVCIAIA